MKNAIKMSILFSGSAAWSPTQPLTGNLPVAWWLSSDLSATPVTSWVDKIAAANAAQATETKQPAYVANQWNGKPTVSFDGGDLLRVAGTVSTASSGTLFAVFSIDNRTGDVTVVGSFDEATATKWWILRISAGLIKITQRNADTEDRVVAQAASLLSVAKPHVVTVQSSGTAWTVRLDGLPLTLTAQSGSNSGDWFGDTTDRDNFILGAFKATSEAQFLTGDEAEVLVYDAVLSAGDVLTVEKYLASRYGVNLVVFDGNSLTLGTNSTTGNDYPSVCVSNLTGNYAHHNLGVASQTTADMIADGVAQVDALYSNARPKNIVVCWEGTNDLFLGATAAAAYNNIVTYCNARRAAGWRVVVATILPRSDVGTPVDFETSRQTVNTSIRNNYTTFANALADVAANTDIGEDDDELNVTYYSADKVHMTNAGYAIVAGIVEAAIETL